MVCRLSEKERENKLRKRAEVGVLSDREWAVAR